MKKWVCSVCGYSYVSDYTGPGIKVEGIVKTSGFDTDEVALTLTEKGEDTPILILELTGNEASYCFTDVTQGEYNITVSKNNHISQNFEFSVVDEEKITKQINDLMKEEIRILEENLLTYKECKNIILNKDRRL